MLRSMTGFGRGVVDASYGRIIVEIQSVNRKHFEASLHLPKELFCFENDLRKSLKEKITRGHLIVRLQLIPLASSIGFPDVDLLQSLKNGYETIASDLGIDPSQVTLPLLLQLMPEQQKSVSIEDDTELQKCVAKALDALLKMKEQEGKALEGDLSCRLKSIEKYVDDIEHLTPNSVEKMRKKLSEKMHALFTSSDPQLEDRLVKEIALFAEKVDISEEITRLKSHFVQVKRCLSASVPIGRKMEFVLQEISREVNTIGSKSMDANIAYLIVEIKSEIEKMREQIQNVE